MIYNYNDYKELEKVFERNKNKGCLTAIIIVLLIIALFFGVCCLIWWIEMLLWNYALCAVFTSIPQITFWKLAGIDILASMLFKSSSLPSKSSKSSKFSESSKEN